MSPEDPVDEDSDVLDAWIAACESRGLTFCSHCHALPHSSSSSCLVAPLGLLLSQALPECRMCAFLLRVVQTCVRQDERVGNGFLQVDRRFSKTSLLQTETETQAIRLLCKVFQRGYDCVVPIELCIAREKDIARKALVGTSDESIKIAQLWLHECTQSPTGHENCHSHETTYYPTRLLEISGEEPNLLVRLRERDDYMSLQPLETFRYAALSHCWGPPGCYQLTTTRDTLESKKAGITWSDIPKTYQDAIVFVHRLGIRYLWLDTLCVIQKDMDDWRGEAAHMAEVYSGSYLTIAAANAANSTAGLFQEISPQMQARPAIPLDSVERGARPVLYARRISKYDFDDQESYPLMSRAWAYQERYLSPRVIYFLKEELGWMCRSCVDDETHSNTFSVFADARARHTEALASSLQSIHGNSALDSGHAGTYNNESIAMICHWQRIVGEYSKLALTFEKDKLPAIEGLAKLMKSHRRGRYFSGLWESSFMVDLTWRNCEGGGTRPRERRAPSWSWASVDCEVDFWVWLGRHSIREVARVVGVGCEDLGSVKKPPGDDGPRSGALRISGPVFQDTPVDEVFWDVPKDDDDERELIYLHLFHSRDATKSTSEGENVYLALRRVDGVEEVYERVGLARTRGSLEYYEQSSKVIEIL